MFKISDKYLGLDKREAIEKFKLHDQTYRKKLHPISRELYRYYNQAFHDKMWNPNGLYQRNKFYYFIGPSLGFIDKEGNKRYDKYEQSIENKKEKKDIIRSFPEYKYIEENQFEIIIEYCSNCQEHQTYTFHKAELFHNYAMNLKKCILLRFPFIKVILKPIDTGNFKLRLPKVNNGGNIGKFDIRIGAFEVILCYKKQGNELMKELLFSKLEKKKFPLITKILDRIVCYLPKFKGQIIVYEKEENKNSSNTEQNNETYKDNEKYFMNKELIEGLEINVYLLNNKQILNIANEAWEEIQNQHNPKKRLNLIKEQQLINKIGLETKYINDTNKSNKKIIRSTSMPNISNEENENKFVKTHSTFNSLRQSSVKNEINNNIKSYNIEEIYKNKSYNYKKFIYDKNISRNLKGKLIIRKYTNKDGAIDIGPLPYDSYFVEVTESKQFQSVGICLSFNDLNIYKNNYIKKYIGLLTQENAFILIQVYEIKDNKKDNINDIIHLPKAKVTLKKIMEKKKENKNDENKNIEINIEESNKSGIFEFTVPPGIYILEVEKPNYEKSKNYIDLQKGLNKINIEMHIERYYNLHILVYNYENIKIPIQNADVTIYKNSTEILEESITNKDGEFNYIVDKGLDFLTVVIEKIDYFPVQRIFIRNSKAKINNKGEYEEKMIFYLVKKDFVIKNQIFLIMTYSNLLGNIFDISNIQISDGIKNKINISKNDRQKDGFISTIIKYKSDNDDEEFSTTNENIDDSKEPNNYDNIISISYRLISGKLRINNYEDKSSTMNGLERYGCQTIIYTPKNIFYIPSPGYSPDNYSIWFIGWIDIKNEYFYQANTLFSSTKDRIIFLDEWFEFLQTLINDEIYKNLFEFFHFEKGYFELGDRTLELKYFEEAISNLKYFSNKKRKAIDFICSLFKNRNNKISFSILKKIVTSNLKNFDENYIGFY